MPERGVYSVLEGSDGVGKSTQLELLKQKLDELEVDAVFTREPGGTEFGHHVRNLLLNPNIEILSESTEIALFTAGRIEQWVGVIEPALNEDKLVVSDRNWYSTLAYQVASNPEVEARILAITELLLPPRYVEPDLALVLQVSEQERKRRRDKREEDAGTVADSFESRNDAYFEKVQRIYDGIPRRMGAVAINADGDERTVAKAVWSEYRPYLSSVRSKSTT
ncbi:MAG TPA: dTMP kinase [Candidatus Saccharimonadales bacterium]|jgi:dTMP kinase